VKQSTQIIKYLSGSTVFVDYEADSFGSTVFVDYEADCLVVQSLLIMRLIF